MRYWTSTGKSSKLGSRCLALLAPEALLLKNMTATIQSPQRPTTLSVFLLRFDALEHTFRRVNLRTQKKAEDARFFFERKKAKVSRGFPSATAFKRAGGNKKTVAVVLVSSPLSLRFCPLRLFLSWASAESFVFPM